MRNTTPPSLSSRDPLQLPRTRSDLFQLSQKQQQQLPSSLPSSVNSDPNACSSSSLRSSCGCCADQTSTLPASSFLTKSNSDHSLSLTSQFISASPSSSSSSSCTTTPLQASRETTTFSTSPSRFLSKSIPLPVRTVSGEFNHSFENSLKFGSASCSSISRRRRHSEHENETQTKGFDFSLPPSQSKDFLSRTTGEQEEKTGEDSEMAGMLWRRMCQALGQTTVKVSSAYSPSATMSTLATSTSSSSPDPSLQLSGSSQGTGGGAGAKRRKGGEPTKLPTVEPLSVLGLQLARPLILPQTCQTSQHSYTIAIPQPQSQQYPCLRSSTSSLWLESSPPTSLFLFDEELAKCESPKKPQQTQLPLSPQEQRVSLRLVGGTLDQGVAVIGSKHSLSRSLSRSQFEEEGLRMRLGDERKGKAGEFEAEIENISPNAVVTILEPAPLNLSRPTTPRLQLPLKSTSSANPPPNVAASLNSSFTTVKVLETKEQVTEKPRTPSPPLPLKSGSIKISERSFMYEMTSPSSSTAPSSVSSASARWRFEVSWKDVWMVAVEVNEPYSYWLIFYHASSSGKTKEGALRIPIDEDQVSGSSEELLEAFETSLFDFQLENYLQVLDCAEDVGHIVTVWKEQRQGFIDREEGY